MLHSFNGTQKRNHMLLWGNLDSVQEDLTNYTGTDKRGITDWSQMDALAQILQQKPKSEWFLFVSLSLYPFETKHPSLKRPSILKIGDLMSKSNLVIFVCQSWTKDKKKAAMMKLWVVINWRVVWLNVCQDFSYLIGKTFQELWIMYISPCVFLTWAWHKASINPELKKPRFVICIGFLSSGRSDKAAPVQFLWLHGAGRRKTKTFHVAPILQELFTCLLQV